MDPRSDDEATGNSASNGAGQMAAARAESVRVCQVLSLGLGGHGAVAFSLLQAPQAHQWAPLHGLYRHRASARKLRAKLRAAARPLRQLSAAARRPLGRVAAAVLLADARKSRRGSSAQHDGDRAQLPFSSVAQCAHCHGRAYARQRQDAPGASVGAPGACARRPDRAAHAERGVDRERPFGAPRRRRRNGWSFRMASICASSSPPRRAA